MRYKVYATARAGLLSFGVALAAPAAIAAGALILAGATGIAATRPLDALYATLGVTNRSPLPVRQAWYAGIYLIAPLTAAAIGLAVAASARSRAPFLGLAALGVALAIFWALWSLANH